MQTIRGTLTLTEGFYPPRYQPWGETLYFDGDLCYGKGGYDDIKEGAQVTIRDETDTVIAAGRLSEGQIKTTELGLDLVSADCIFLFEVTDVPSANFYTVEVSHRGGLTYSLDEMDALDWEVSLSLGD